MVYTCIPCVLKPPEADMGALGCSCFAISVDDSYCTCNISMAIFIYLFTYLSIHVYMYTCIYIYICIYMCVCVFRCPGHFLIVNGRMFGRRPGYSDDHDGDGGHGGHGSHVDCDLFQLTMLLRRRRNMHAYDRWLMTADRKSFTRTKIL